MEMGDLEGGKTLAHLGMEGRKVGIQEKSLEEKPQYQTLEDASGNKRLVRINPLGGAVSDVTPKELGGEPANPFSSGKMNEAQSKDALYASRMLTAEKVLRDPEVIAAGGHPTERARAAIPLIGNYLVGEKYQKYDQAQRDFINATLRRESGAVISDAEFTNARKQYFPVPGDSPAVLQQKQQNRVEAIRGIGAGAGPGWKSPYSISEAGELVPRPKAPAAPQGGGQSKLPPGITPDGAIAEARDAIRAGKNPQAVAQRLRQWGIDPAGL